MSQSKRASFVESVLNVGSGYLMAIGIQLAIFPLYDLNIELKQSAQIALFFTLLSVIRGYIFRRIFNRITIRRGDGNQSIIR